MADGRPKWTDVAIAILTIALVAVAGVQLYVYVAEKGIMEESFSQNERSIILGQGQLGVAGRNAQTAEGTLAEVKTGGVDTHNLAKAASDQVAKLQAGVEQTARLANNTAGANTLAAQAMENQSRPWIAIEDPTDVTTIGPSLHFRAKLVNYGQSLAVRVVHTEKFGLFRGKVAPRSWFETYKICPEPVDVSENIGKDADIVFPGKDAAVTQEVDAVDLVSPPAEPTLISPASYNLLYGCIAYRGAIGGPYYTKVIYHIAVKVRSTHDVDLTILSHTFYDAQ
jgi:hypothetical protein